MTSCCRRLSESMALAALSPAVAAFVVALTRPIDWPCATALKIKIAIEVARMRRFIGGFVIIWRGPSRVDQSQWPCLRILYIQRRHVCPCVISPRQSSSETERRLTDYASRFADASLNQGNYVARSRNSQYDAPSD